VIDKIVIASVSAVFGAGVAWATLKRMGKDVNGIGRKVNRLKDAALVFCPPEQRKEIAQFLDR
jgi:hypothetical protein